MLHITKYPFSNEMFEVFSNYPSQLQTPLLKLRELIFQTAAEDRQIGMIEEVLKWGEPSYLTSQSKSGSTLRIAPYKKSENKYAIFVNCKTKLIAIFKSKYPQQLKYDGNRAMIFDVNKDIPTEIIQDCIHITLTYHINGLKEQINAAL